MMRRKAPRNRHAIGRVLFGLGKMDKLYIFVSGTIEDMKRERKAVSDAIHSLHLDAIRAETEMEFKEAQTRKRPMKKKAQG